MKPQFRSRLHPWPRETHRGAGAIRHSTSALQTVRPVCPPLVMLQELPRYDPQGARLQPLVLAKMAYPALNRLPDSLVFRPRSTRCLQLYHPKRCAPNRGVWLLQPETAQNCDGWRVQSNPMPSGPLQQSHAHTARDWQPNLARRLKRSYYLATL